MYGRVLKTLKHTILQDNNFFTYSTCIGIENENRNTVILHYIKNLTFCVPSLWNIPNKEDCDIHKSR